jgi:hypothetical protein
MRTSARAPAPDPGPPVPPARRAEPTTTGLTLDPSRAARPGGSAATTSASSSRVPRRARAARAQWRRLGADVVPTGVFRPESLRADPEALQRWLRRAVASGVVLGTAVHLSMHGQLRLRGTWRDFAADQLIVPGRGYVWAATLAFGGLPCRGFDSYVDGVGEMRWKVLGALPVLSATGEDVSRSAAGRLAVECVVAPTGFGSAHWTGTADPDVVRGRFCTEHGCDDVDVRVDAHGDVVSASMLRWGAEDGPARLREFGADASAHATFAGVSIPTRLRVGWDWGTERWATGEFFRAEITDARLLVPGGA